MSRTTPLPADQRYFELVQTLGEQSAQMRKLQAELDYMRGVGLTQSQRLARIIDWAIDESRFQMSIHRDTSEVTDLLEAAAARESGIETVPDYRLAEMARERYEESVE